MMYSHSSFRLLEEILPIKSRIYLKISAFFPPNIFMLLVILTIENCFLTLQQLAGLFNVQTVCFLKAINIMNRYILGIKMSMLHSFTWS